MKVLVVASRRDPAAINIAHQLSLKYGVREWRDGSQDSVTLKFVGVEGIHADDANSDVKADSVIFASKHRSESGEAAMTVHTTGNPANSAALGGKPRSLSWVDPFMARAALRKISEEVAARRLNYTVSMEATHHGPTELGVPTLFVEIGSSEPNWADDEAGEVAADAIWSAATSSSLATPAVGFGGGHYARKHSEAVLGGEYAVGHILSKYFFKDFDADIIRIAFDRTLHNCRTALVEWKGMTGSERSRLLEILQDAGLEYIRI